MEEDDEQENYVIESKPYVTKMLHLVQQLSELKIEDLDSPEKIKFYHDAIIDLQNQMNQLMSQMKPPTSHTPIGASFQAIIPEYDPNIPLDPDEIQYKLNVIYYRCKLVYKPNDSYHKVVLKEVPEYKSLPYNLQEEIKEDLSKRKSRPKIDQIYYKKAKYQQMSFKGFVDLYYRLVAFDFDD